MAPRNYPNSSSSFSSTLIFLQANILLYSISFSQPDSNNIVTALGNETDRLALLKFKESISHDPLRVLSSWNDSFHFCEWPGIACGRRHQRVTALNLTGYYLRGTLSPYIGNLTFLRSINLANNSFVGEIPQQLGRLFRLQHLNLGDNMLEGKIALNLSYCSQLEILRLSHNKLVGNIPSELGLLVRLVRLILGSNNLTGGIPVSLGNLSSLTLFSVHYSHLVGTVPNEFGRLKSLTYFALGSNNLSGEIPLSLFNISSLIGFSIAENLFRGNLPWKIGYTLPNLQKFAIGVNNFSGIIPESFSNASKLEILDIGENNFMGQVPTSFGKLKHLQWLGLSDNNLGSYSANSLDFISSLTNCSQMEALILRGNKFGGVLPNAVANLSTKFTLLVLARNQISGTIPANLENLYNLIGLMMGFNHFTGIVPASLGNLKKLQLLELQFNKLSGSIPSSVGNLTNVFRVNLANNNLTGTIPIDIAHCRNLKSLDLSSNSLRGDIPKEVFDLTSLSTLLDLSRNSLTGVLPLEVGKLKNVNALDLSENNLTGEIPNTIGDCQSLEYLLLQGNFFQGILPSTLSSLKALRYMDFSRNNLTGPIPKDLQLLTSLLYLNLSFNDLEGEVPNEGIFQNTSATSVVGNYKLCGGVPKLQLQACPIKESKHGMANRLKVTIVIACVAAFFALLSAFVIFNWRWKSARKSSLDLSTIGFLSKVSYKTLYQATNGFSPSMLIGTRSFGSVYKGTFDQEESPVVAVKVLNLQQKGASKSFVAECKALRNIRHRNLVKIFTCCSSMDYNGNEFMALVYEYMSNGSLEKWLHLETSDGNRWTGLNLTQRLNVATDVASALSYLHNDCDQPIIHCDLKPSNILLDNEMIAHISDFGLARFISATTGAFESKSSTNAIKGTVGYSAPEYAMGGEASKQGDVYSYGILLLEMLTGKRPTDEMFKDDFNLHNFVKTALPERLVQIVDSALLPRQVEETSSSREEGNIGTHLQKCLVSVLEIGVACSKESPNERMNIGDVSKELQHIRKAYNLDGSDHELANLYS